MSKWVFVAGVALGYVLGAKAGRERYEQLMSSARKIQQNPSVQNATEVLQEQAGQMAGACKDKLMNTGIGSRIMRDDSASDTGKAKSQYWDTADVSGSTHSEREAPGF